MGVDVHTDSGARLAGLSPFLASQRPGPLVFEHVVGTGNGRVAADRAVLAEVAGTDVLHAVGVP